MNNKLLIIIFNNNELEICWLERREKREEMLRNDRGGVIQKMKWDYERDNLYEKEKKKSVNKNDHFS